MMRIRSIVAVAVAIASIAVLAGIFQSQPTRPPAAAPGNAVDVVAAPNTPAMPPVARPVQDRISASAPPAVTAVAPFPDDPAIGASLPPRGLTPRDFYERIRAEPRDSDWAPRMEQAIKAALVPIPYVAAGASRIVCRSSLCELYGETVRDASMANVNVAMQALQGPQLRDPLTKQGLSNEAAVFGGGSASSTFTLYFVRK